MMKKEKKEVAPKATSANIEDTLQAIKTKFGDDAIMKLGEKPKVNVNAISTGSVGLDAALGIGGLPPGRKVEKFGPESSRKKKPSSPLVFARPKNTRNPPFL